MDIVEHPDFRGRVHRGVFHLMSLVAPYLTADFRYFYDECCTLFDVLTKDA